MANFWKTHPIARHKHIFGKIGQAHGRQIEISEKKLNEFFKNWPESPPGKLGFWKIFGLVFQDLSIRANGFSSGYVPAANGSQTEEYNPEEGINEDEVPAYKPSLAFIEENYVSCVTSDDPKPNPDSGYDNAKEDSSDSDSG